MAVVEDVGTGLFCGRHDKLLGRVLGIEHTGKVNQEACSFLPRSGSVQQANGADAVTYWSRGFSLVARAAHRRRRIAQQ